MRYNTQPKKKTFNGKSVYLTSRYPAIPYKTSDIYVITDAGDRLDLLANEYYGKSDLWWIIATANGVGKGVLRLEPSIQLRIPTDIEPIIAEYRRLNNVT